MDICTNIDDRLKVTERRCNELDAQKTALSVQVEFLQDRLNKLEKPTKGMKLGEALRNL